MVILNKNALRSLKYRLYRINNIRRLHELITLGHELMKEKGHIKFLKSMAFSIKYGCYFYHYHACKVTISPSAVVGIGDNFKLNIPWEGCVARSPSE